MWKCQNCKTEIDDDSFEFCWNCSAPKTAASDEVWTCSACKTRVETNFVFCSNCGQPKEQQQEPVPLSSADKNDVVEAAESRAMIPAPVTLSVQPFAPMPVRPVYDTSIFASQFPEWDLLPPAMLVRRIKRSI